MTGLPVRWRHGDFKKLGGREGSSNEGDHFEMGG